MRPFGYFVHHQGRGHAERCAAVVNALPSARPVTIFCARDDIFPPLGANAAVQVIPSLFEPSQPAPPALAAAATPVTLHCAPLGWPGIRRAMREMADWFDRADPALLIVDVSAEVAQLARICSVPHVKVLQHGDRTDPGHCAAYDGAVGLLAPFAAGLAQPDWTTGMTARTHFAAGLGLPTGGRLTDRAEARRALGIGLDERMVLVLSGGGGDGMSLAALGVGARADPDARWIAIGKVQTDWHATAPGNLSLRGWVNDPARYLTAADLVVSSAGNTTCHEVLDAGLPWIVVPEWRYFDEQHAKAAALGRVGAAHVLDRLPSSAQSWRRALGAARVGHDPRRQRGLVTPDAAAGAARWLEALAARLWAPAPTIRPAAPVRIAAPDDLAAPVLPIAAE